VSFDAKKATHLLICAGSLCAFARFRCVRLFLDRLFYRLSAQCLPRIIETLAITNTGVPSLLPWSLIYGDYNVMKGGTCLLMGLPGSLLPRGP
jgi:hypothetical protein